MLKVAPEKFWDFSAALFKQQTEFFDARVANEGRNKTYERLAKIAGQVGVNESQVMGLLKISEDPNDQAHAQVGNGVTVDIKRMVKVSAGSCSFRPTDCMANTLRRTARWESMSLRLYFSMYGDPDKREYVLTRPGTRGTLH